MGKKKLIALGWLGESLLCLGYKHPLMHLQTENVLVSANILEPLLDPQFVLHLHAMLCFLQEGLRVVFHKKIPPWCNHHLNRWHTVLPLTYL